MVFWGPIPLLYQKRTRKTQQQVASEVSFLKHRTHLETPETMINLIGLALLSLMLLMDRMGFGTRRRA